MSDARLVSLVRGELGDRPSATVVVLGSGRRGLVDALVAASPTWTVVEAATDADERQVQLTLLDPIDAIIDVPSKEGRLFRFRTVFFHVRAHGLYVVPGGAVELGPGRGKLGDHLASAAALAEEPLRGGRLRSIAANALLAVRMHVQATADGEDLVLRHDLPDVLAKLDEPQTSAWIERSGHGHRILSTIPAEDPPSAAVITEVPVLREPPMDRAINRADLTLRDYRDVVVDVEQLVIAERVLPAETYRHHQNARLVNRGVVDVGPRLGVPQRPVRDDLPRLEGTFVHLDNEVRGHFGHLMTETLSRVWTWQAALAIDPGVRALMSRARGRPEIADWEYHFYETCGIPRDRIVKIDSAVRVERLLSGTPMLSNPEYVHPRIAQTWDEVGDRLAAEAGRTEWPRRIFIARRIAKRACDNADVVERMFADRGFEIVYPEDLSLGDQVAMFRSAEVVAGFAGSGMFQIAFVPHPIHVIQVGSSSYTPRNEVLMAAVRGHRIDSVVCATVASNRVQAGFTFDVDAEGPALLKVLDGLPPLS
ncbi:MULTISPECIES: glycosyltransferase family 61 protein [unclassified Nocardioides]|uniref:glycosyltransferase family 61 protein n=1 Tax=unclassified Nocardioides TaxID=2615069 RepID=UPI0006F5C26A|nr:MULTISPECIES: glycosyltransferase 61 family protein [unclassified Nocardioides]KRA29957.1 hypothetical protein ASD81_19880 [Nocardioides sp. Root614]KRA86878.1 hypothetical protein ASD84_22095 [Nocardioides sp. Root682]